MNKEVATKLHNRAQRKARIRKEVSGSKDCPRLTISISNNHISCQLIDDSSSKTLASASTVGKKVDGTMTEKAIAVGKEIAKNAKGVKVSKVVFDRNGKKYNGRIKAFADSARESGLVF